MNHTRWRGCPPPGPQRAAQGRHELRADQEPGVISVESLQLTKAAESVAGSSDLLLIDTPGHASGGNATLRAADL